jgi:hypothetical protein
VRYLTAFCLLLFLFAHDADAGLLWQPVAPCPPNTPGQATCAVTVELAGASTWLFPFPATGSERVSDALARVPGLRSSPNEFKVVLHRYSPGNEEQVINVSCQDAFANRANLVLVPGDWLDISPRQSPPGGPGHACVFDPVERVRLALRQLLPW